MKINYKLLTDKIDEHGMCPVFIRSSLYSQPFKYFTGEKCKISDWDSVKMKFKRSHPNYQKANEIISKLNTDIEVALHDFRMRKIIPTVLQLKEVITPKVILEEPKIEANSIVELYAEFLVWSELKGKKIGTLKGLKTTYNHLTQFCSNKPIYVDEFTKEVYDTFINWMMSNFEYQPNYIGCQTKHIKTFFGWCVSEKNLTLSENHAKMSAISYQVEKIYLTQNDIEKLKKVILVEHLQRVRDVFLFACYTGLRHSDLYKLSPSNIIDVNGRKVISFTPVKTDSYFAKSRKKLQIALIPEAVEIIEKYKDLYVKSLPVLTNQKMNEYMKIVGQKAGIDELVEVFTYKNNASVSEEIEKYKLITCHSARHTFATQSLSRGVSIDMVQKLMGHSDIKTTQIYAKLVDEYTHDTLLNAWK
jgi:integrase/recombinase XerD